METLDIVMTTAFSVLVTANLVGNILVCIIILRSKEMKTPMNYLLLNLAFSDMTVGLFVSPQFIFSRLFQHPGGLAGRMLCVFITGGNLLWTGAIASAYSLVAIAFERYYAILDPYGKTSSKVTVKRVVFISATVWSFALVFILPLQITIDFNKERNYCVWMLPTSFLQKGYGVACVFVGGLVPISIMTYLYSRVGHSLWFTRDRILTISQQGIIKTRKRVTKMVFIVTVIYAICWTPNLIIQLLATLGPYEEFGSIAYQVSVMLITLNSSVNPVVYTLHSKPFRKSLKELFLWPRFGKVAPEESGSHKMQVSRKGRLVGRSPVTVSESVRSPMTVSTL